MGERTTYGAGFGVLVAVLLWAGFAFMAWKLSDERVSYALLQADVSLQEMFWRRLRP
jgi:hypothetical protein